MSVWSVDCFGRAGVTSDGFVPSPLDLHLLELMLRGLTGGLRSDEYANIPPHVMMLAPFLLAPAFLHLANAREGESWLC